MHVNVTDFISDVSDSIQGNWTRAKPLLLQRFPALSAPLLSFQTDILALRKAVVEQFGLDPAQAEREIRTIAHKADYFELAPQTLRAISMYWSELTASDLGHVNGQRSALVSLLSTRYALPRHHGWQQVNSFFARKNNHQ